MSGEHEHRPASFHESPREALLDFLESTYAAGAKCAKWDRAALERVTSNL